MTIDGFSPQDTEALASMSLQSVQRTARILNWFAKHLNIQIDGIDNIPEGRCLLVANHAFGFDIIFPMALIYQATGRVVWALGEHAWWKFPFIRKLVTSVGTVDGTQNNLDRLLSADCLVLVMPGGLREAMKPQELRYQLLWGHRYGFVRAAIRTSTPLVPLACVGADDLFNLVGNAFVRGARLGFPLPKPAFGVPVPHLRPFRYILGEPIHLDIPAERADDPETLRKARHEVEGALHELIENELARRAGMTI